MRNVTALQHTLPPHTRLQSPASVRRLRVLVRRLLRQGALNLLPAVHLCGALPLGRCYGHSTCASIYTPTMRFSAARDGVVHLLRRGEQPGGDLRGKGGELASAAREVVICDLEERESRRVPSYAAPSALVGAVNNANPTAEVARIAVSNLP